MISDKKFTIPKILRFAIIVLMIPFLIVLGQSTVTTSIAASTKTGRISEQTKQDESRLDQTTPAILDSTTVSPTLAYVASYEHLVLVDPLLHVPVASIDLAQYGCSIPQIVKLTPNLDQLYVYCPQSNEIIVFDTSNNAYLATIPFPTWGFQGDLAFTRDGAYAVAGSDETENVYVIDTATFAIIKTIHSIFPLSLATHPYLPLIYIGGYRCCNAGFIQVLDTSTFSIETTMALGFYIHDVQPSPDGQWLYASDFYGEGIYKIDAQTNEAVDSISGTEWFADIKLSPDGSKLYVVDDFNEAVVVIDAANFSVLNSIWIGVNALDLEINCDGSELWIANELNTIPVINTQDFSIPYHILMPEGDARSIAMCSPINSGVFARKVANQRRASPGEVVDYTLSFYNYGQVDLVQAAVTDTLPILLNYVEGSLNASSGSLDYQNGVISWTGLLTATKSVDINYSVKIAQSVIFGTSIMNTAIFSSTSETLTRDATIEIVPYQVYIPCARRACGPSYFDNFSDPSSGWPISESQHGIMAYVNGEYHILVKDAGWLVFANKDVGVNDYKVEVDTRPAAYIEGATGIIFGRTNDGFYLYEISDGYFSLWRYDPSGWAQLIGWQPSDAIAGRYATNHIAVVRKQSEIELYANGTLIAQTNDSTYLGSGVGMVSEAFVANYDGHFDNFAVTTGVCIDALSTAMNPSSNQPFIDSWIQEYPSTTRPEP